MYIEVTMEDHDTLVSAISARVRSFYEQQKPFRLYHGSTNSTRCSNRSVDNTVDTSRLSRVLRVDTAGKTALAEPNVPMDALVDATLEHGLVPLVVMEFPGITVGGGFSGTAGESSSFRHGLFDATIESIEMVLADGTVEKASQRGNKELFWGSASAFGTLGVATLLEVRLREAKAYVRLEYVLARGPEEAVKTLEAECGSAANDYVEGVAFSPTETVVCVGRLVDELPAGATPTRFLGRSDPWFFSRVDDARRELLKKQGGRQQQLEEEEGPEKEKGVGEGERVVDYVPLKDYLFRWDRGSFWLAKHAFSYFGMPMTRLTCYLFDPLVHTRELFRALHTSGLTGQFVIQDVGVPPARAVEFQRWLDAEMGTYPLWLCPMYVHRADPGAAHGLHADFADPPAAPGNIDLLNFGIWGRVRGGRRTVVDRNRALERKVAELRGKKCLYGEAFYTEDEFWSQYDRPAYDRLRQRYRAQHLPSVYDKIKVDVVTEESAKRANWRARMGNAVMNTWPMPGLRGMRALLAGSEYLLRSKRRWWR
ncbi:Delta(24)-sterol reductase [Escovopsis weberi]|uniref:Delta(24)-sterol reductase n=1 Tax=Escovopsis weberi TaxID=150374 RepID=A0A0M8MUG6_ESCWE|nr:Delta(24)-sterol reductase [Escovopsis weberi]